MKLLFVFTGGTIGCAVAGGFLSPDRKKSYELLELYDRKYHIDFDYDVVEPYIELSENNSGNTVRMLAECVLNHIGQPYDGIIVTHGTDTIQYSAAALSYVLGSAGIPVCIVSSNFPIDNPASNGLINLHGAIRFILNEKPHGVWVSYQNPHEDLKLHRGTRLLPGNAYSSDIASVNDLFFGCYDSNMVFHRNPRYTEKADEIAPLSPCGLSEFCEAICRIAPYPGMKYPAIDSAVKYIIHETYHSGTINSKQSDLNGFMETIGQKRLRIFLTGAYDGESYDSTRIYGDSIIRPVRNVAPIAVFMKVWMAYTSGIAPENILDKSLGGDVF